MDRSTWPRCERDHFWLLASGASVGISAMIRTTDGEILSRADLALFEPLWTGGGLVTRSERLRTAALLELFGATSAQATGQAAVGIRDSVVTADPKVDRRTSSLLRDRGTRQPLVVRWVFCLL